MKNSLKMSYKRISWRPMKNNNQELVCQRLDYVKFYNNAIQSGFKIIQVDEFNINRGTVSNMAWIKKGYPAFMLQVAPAEKYSVLTAISNTVFDAVQSPLCLVPPCEIGRILVFEKIFDKIFFVKNYAFELYVN